MRFKIQYIASVFLLIGFVTKAQLPEFEHTNLFSFEKNTTPFITEKGSKLTLSPDHYKHGSNSMKWDWNTPQARISMKIPIGYKRENPNPKETAVSTFIFWVYAKENIPGGKLKFEFLKKGKVCSSFEYGTDFTGWRGAWIAFDRDMQGTPDEEMDELRITAPDVADGTLYFDHIIPSSFQDIRQHTADFQAPFVNPNTNSHWLVLLRSWNNPYSLPIAASITTDEISNIQKIEERLKEIVLVKKTPNMNNIRKKYAEYNLQTNTDGTIKGEPIFFERYGETYINMGGPRKFNSWYANHRGLSRFNDYILEIATAYNNSSNKAEQEELATYFVALMRHMLDQGFEAGSALGTLHHLGYSMRNYYPAVFLMKDVLTQAGLRHRIQQAMEWFAGTGEIKLAPGMKGMDIDTFNTNLLGRLASILMKEDTPEKATYLYSFTRWLNNGLDYAPGTAGSFKVDGTIFHHRRNYPAYAIGGLEGAINMTYILNRTQFAVSQEAHQHLKKGLLTMRIYCNTTQWPLALSGRHPDGTGALIPRHYGRLALAGSPDRKENIDSELAGAYLRLAVTEKKPAYSKQLIQAGFKAENEPNGNWGINYGCLSVHRRDHWLAAATGFSRYFWATESYIGANYYGRYLNHGALQIMASGSPVTNAASGFEQEGWDWNHFPGTTATVLSFEQLKADIRNVDVYSGYEEMLLSDESFAGGISNRQTNGAFGMILHENDKYNGSLRARKSYFFFDNRIVALGSDIESGIDTSLTMTTLFQQYLPQESAKISIDGKDITQFPFAETLTGNHCLGDGKNNYYYVRNGETAIHKKEQHSRDEEKDVPTKNNFALAAISHGKAPQSATYEYMVLVQPTPAEKIAVDKEMNHHKSTPYIVLQHNKHGHIVKDKKTETTGYVLFDAGEVKAGEEIRSVSLPCLVMTHRADSKRMTLSVCDPDMRFYEGKADEIYDKNGKTIERSIYSRDWINNLSKVSEIKLILHGKWKPVTGNEYIHTFVNDNKTTTVLVSCQDGMTREIELSKM